MKFIRTLSPPGVSIHQIHEGRITEVAVRRMYDHYDTHPFRDAVFADLGAATAALAAEEDLEGGTYIFLPTVSVHVTTEH